MPNTKLDKYDEVGREIAHDCAPMYFYQDIAEILRKRFPPIEVSEDALMCAREIADNAMKPVYEEPCDNYEREVDIPKAAALIEAFARSRVEPWREALRRALADFARNDWGTELPSESEAWVHKTRALLSDSPAPEARHE